jgi:hypothetical protein
MLNGDGAGNAVSSSSASSFGLKTCNVRSWKLQGQAQEANEEWIMQLLEEQDRKLEQEWQQAQRKRGRRKKGGKKVLELKGMTTKLEESDMQAQMQVQEQEQVQVQEQEQADVIKELRGGKEQEELREKLNDALDSCWTLFEE